MRKFFIPLLLFVAASLMSYGPPRETDCGYSPILMTREQLNKSIKYERDHPMISPGKIYLKGNYIFIVENLEGIHVINNIDRARPSRIGFINIPGCVDIATKGSVLYADNAVDLVSIEMSEFPNIQLLNRNENVFPEINSPGCEYVPNMYSENNRPAGTIIVGWVKSN